jgi:hypothetical protein
MVSSVFHEIIIITLNQSLLRTKNLYSRSITSLRLKMKGEKMKTNIREHLNVQEPFHGIGGKLRWIIPAIAIGLMAFAVAFPTPAWTQDDMQILRDKIKADKKLVVASNMQLTESEAKAFWPVYEQYQKDLLAINQRIAKLIEDYAADYRGNTLTDEKAMKLVNESVAIEKAEAGLKESYIPKLSKVLPAKKVGRYIQIENKIRALVKYELAGGIPLVK